MCPSLYSKSLCYLNTMITPKIRMDISQALKSIHITSPQIFYLFASWMTRDLWFPGTVTSSPKHFMYIKDLTGFKQRIYLQNDAKNRNLFRNKKWKICDFSSSHTAIQNHEVQVYRNRIDEHDQYELESQQIHLWFTNQRFEMLSPVVMYVDFEPAIDEKNKHKPIILSCLAMFRIPTIQTQL